MAEKRSKEGELFAKYLAENRILIADTSSASRTRMMKTLVDLGAKSNKVSIQGDYETAMQELETHKPKIVLTDYYLGSKSGFDLLQNYNKIYPELKDGLFVLVTGNSSQSSVARAAEEDVDTYILKPYTVQSFSEALTKGAIAKLFPSDYIRKVEEGKELLFSGKAQDSISVFEAAMKMSKNPSLACFYHGQAEAMIQALDEAQGSFRKGLTFNKIHYKCLVGLYELCMEQKRFPEAYEVVKKIANFFPANPKRLASVLHLAITTQNFEDVKQFYEIFKSIDERNDELVRYICSAMIVAGKYFFKTEMQNEGVEILKNAAISAAGRPPYLRVITETFANQGFLKEAEETLKRFPMDEQKGTDFAVAKFFIALQGTDLNAVVENARLAIDGDTNCDAFYRAYIQRLLRENRRGEAEGILQKAIKLWPEQTEKFKLLLEVKTAA